MAGTININRSVDDAFYRYKMPKLIAKVEGKGNGIKTVIANMTEIAKALNRPPTYSTKYFGCELGAQTQFDLKNERYIVNGEHDAAKLQGLLDGFIKKFVLCPGCENPETTLTVRKNQILQACKACGFSNVIEQKHKLTTFILKNPPDDNEIATAVVQKASTNIKSAKKAKKGKESSNVSSPTEDKDQPDFNDVDGAAEVNGRSANGSNDEDDWEPEDWKEGDALDKPEITGKMAGLIINEDMDKSVDERLDMFYNFLVKEREKAKSGNGQLDSKRLLAEAERLDVKEKAVLLLTRAIFDIKSGDLLHLVKPNRNVFLRFTNGNQRAQRYLLGGLEQLVAANEKDLLPRVPHLLKAFYDTDIIEEEVLLEWGQKSSKKYVPKEDNKKMRDKAEPFLKWLTEAEEEESEEDEDDIQVSFGNEDSKNKAPHASVMRNGLAHVGKQPQSAAVGSVEDDFNIDDI